ncbi:BHLH domain-containing protein [Heracleum sosnowskyi]|uniref:BHLH domain-containing protein n=1 Tax=Heracleum sosnowskyi TaxID=360622 RepID=A0AAD8MK12_9APIA|nr:BHLH domain-containing protein [Heracleum sosnowskyi]
MALSYYSNWGTQVLDHLKQDQTTITAHNSNSTIFPQEQFSQDLLLPPELLNFHDNIDTCIDTLFSQNNLFYYPDDNVDAYTALCPSPVPLNTLPPLPSPQMVEEDACFDHYPKQKTQELGKLIPGGQKMNTAEMFQAAFKYIKLLQAQVGVLQLMQEQNEEGMYSPELEALVTSPLIQEKLYSAEKCLVPTNFVKSLTRKPHFQSNSRLIKDLIKLI